MIESNLIASRELCKLIPQGEFENCSFSHVFLWKENPKELYGETIIGYWWLVRTRDGFGIFPKQPKKDDWDFVRKFFPQGHVCREHYPAPMLQEILLEIEKAGGWCPTAYRLNDCWTVDCQDDKEDIMNDVMEQTDPDNPATAALKLWLKLKGIKYE